MINVNVVGKFCLMLVVMVMMVFVGVVMMCWVKFGVFLGVFFILGISWYRLVYD